MMNTGITLGNQPADIRWGSLVLLGIVAVIFGLLILLFPGISAVVLVEIIGIFIVLLSFAVIMISAVASGGWKGSMLVAVLGVVGFFFGVATILSPVVMGQVIFSIIGVVLFIAGLLTLVLAIAEKYILHRGLFAIQGIASVILGLLIVILPVVGTAIAVGIIGLYFVFWGILSMVLGYSFRAMGA